VNAKVKARVKAAGGLEERGPRNLFDRGCLVLSHLANSGLAASGWQLHGFLITIHVVVSQRMADAYDDNAYQHSKRDFS
jgi:hypothetical protein